MRSIFSASGQETLDLGDILSPLAGSACRPAAGGFFLLFDSANGALGSWNSKNSEGIAAVAKTEQALLKTALLGLNTEARVSL